MMESRQTNPIQDLFVDIKKILDFIEVKDQNEAISCETEESVELSEIWLSAKREADTYLTYKSYWNIPMFQEVVPNVKFNDIEKWIQNPSNTPLIFRDNLLLRGREEFNKQYQEKNKYYRMIGGLPPIDEDPNEFIYLSEELQNTINAHTDSPVHELSVIVQNKYISTDEYKKILEENPDKKYLKYLGIYKVNMYVARVSRDFELIRYLPMSRSDINPNLLKEFGSLYNDYRNYVMTVLYNKHLEGVYDNYRNFMGFLIKCFVLMQISNKAIEGGLDRKFLDDNVLHIILSMYGIPRTLLMTKEVRRELVTNILKLTRAKATDEVYYNLIDILGYQDIVISKLMLMRGQDFGENGQTKFANGENLDSFLGLDNIVTTYEDTQDTVEKLKTDPYFLAIDLKDDDPYDTIVTNSAPLYSYHEIVDDDPTWWDLDDTQALVRDSNYSIADSKYIMVEAVIHQVKFLSESIYFTRMILDNKIYTDKFDITIPEIFGTDTVSIYDLMVFLISATCMNYGMSGNIITPEEGLFATAGFNFDIDLELFQAFLDTTSYADKERIMSFIQNLSMTTTSDINRLFNEVLSPMREWLESKIAQSQNRHEFIEYENIYRALFTYDISRNSFLNDFEMPMKVIQKYHELSDEDISMYMHYYPRTYQGEAVTVDNFHQSKYYPFPTTWHIDIPYKGRLYFHDILNSEDIRYLTVKDGEDNEGEYIFMDSYDDGEGNITYELDRDAIRDALSGINSLLDEELHDAEFKVDTPIIGSGGRVYVAGTRLPANIRRDIFKKILTSKIIDDTNGLATPPETYSEYLYRKNKGLYNLLMDGDRFIYDKDSWLEDIMTITLALETELNMHLKHFEQSIVGTDLFFKPLITLIKHFKSTFINFAKTGLKYVFGDKVDSGGNSNMFKLFDFMSTTIQFVLLSKRGHESQFGLYDTVNKTKYSIIMKDASTIIELGNEQNVSNRRSWMGSIRMVDEMKFMRNGKQIDPTGHSSMFYSGESGVGRWSEEEDVLLRTRRDTERVLNLPVDTEGWKEFVESYNPE